MSLSSSPQKSGLPVKASVLEWASQRARLDEKNLPEDFQKTFQMRLTGEKQPTLKQLEKFAKQTHTALGYFFLPEPPTLTLPVPDFRTLRDEALREPSNNLYAD